jgi:hypothetical protein
MRGDPDALRTLLRDAIGDERLYQARFSTPMMGDPTNVSDPDVLYEAVRDEAERIEQTVGCVTAVVQRDDGFPHVEPEVILFAMLPRHTDRDLFHRVIDEAQHRIMTSGLDDAEGGA